MALRSGRVGVNPDDVDPITGKVKSSTPTDVYTKTQADNKFETKTHAGNTYVKKEDAADTVYTNTIDHTGTWSSLCTSLFTSDVIAAIRTALEANKPVFFFIKTKTATSNYNVKMLKLYTTASGITLSWDYFTYTGNTSNPRLPGGIRAYTVEITSSVFAYLFSSDFQSTDPTVIPSITDVTSYYPLRTSSGAPAEGSTCTMSIVIKNI